MAESPEGSLIGGDVWDCSGYAITPEMRREVLREFSDLSALRTEGIAKSLSTEQVLSTLVVGHGYTEPVEISDLLDDWIATWTYERWGGEDLMLDLRENSGSGWIDPMTGAQALMIEWICRLDLNEILEWRSQK